MLNKLNKRMHLVEQRTMQTLAQERKIEKSLIKFNFDL